LYEFRLPILIVGLFALNSGVLASCKYTYSFIHNNTYIHHTLCILSVGGKGVSYRFRHHFVEFFQLLLVLLLFNHSVNLFCQFVVLRHNTFSPCIQHPHNTILCRCSCSCLSPVQFIYIYVYT